MTRESDEPRRSVRRAPLVTLILVTALLGVVTSGLLGSGTPAASRPEPTQSDRRAAELPGGRPESTGRPAPLAGAVPVSPPEPIIGGRASAVAVGTFVAVGDSITAGIPAEGTVSDPGPTSWLSDPSLVPGRLVGGWARSGAITADMRDAVAPSPADLLILLGGTNDLARGIPWLETAADLRVTAATVGARTVLLVATPPSTGTPAERTAFNARLVQLAAEEGWHHVDPWTAFDAAGAFSPGSSDDGIHPTPLVARAAGRAIGAAMAQLYRSTDRHHELPVGQG